MSIAELENFSLNNWFYNLDNKLWEHVMLRSEKAFGKAEKIRKRIKNPEELRSYISKMREFFIESIGGIPYNKTLPLNARTVGVIKENGLKIEKIIYESRKNVYVTANLYIPEKRKNPCGAVLLQMGHSRNGKAYVQYQHVARAISSVGLIVMAIDPIGQGERISYWEPELKASMVPGATRDHMCAGEQCFLTGKPITRYFIADAMRAIDYLETRAEVDKDRIGATGNSGGGTATCHLILCDDRIKAAAPGTFLTTRRDYLYAGGAQDSEQIWHGASENGFDHYELLMCFAPKPLMLLTVDSDFFPIEGTEKLYETCKDFWKMFGCDDNLLMVKDESLHEYTDKLAIEAAKFFSEHLNSEKRTPDPSALKSIAEETLWCTKSGIVSIDFPDCKFVFDENLEEFNAGEKPKTNFKKFLLDCINFERVEENVHLRSFPPMYECGLKITPYLWFAQKNLPNYGLMFAEFSQNPIETVICLWDRGTDNLEEHIYQITEICKSGKQAFVIDLSGMGKCSPHSLNPGNANKATYGMLYRIAKDLSFLGDSLCALRLFELRYAVKMIKNKFGENVSLIAEGVSAAYGRLLKEIDRDIDVKVERAVPNYDELVKSKYYIDYNIAGILIPGIARYFKNDLQRGEVTDE